MAKARGPRPQISSCCWFGDHRIVHAARAIWWQGRATACGRWVWDKAIRRDGYPGRVGKPVSCPECVRVLAQLEESGREGATGVALPT